MNQAKKIKRNKITADISATELEVDGKKIAPSCLDLNIFSAKVNSYYKTIPERSLKVGFK